MYLHIGKDFVVDERKIIGIFNKEAIKEDNNVIDISDGVQKTFILIEDKEIKGYITNISSKTLKNRNKVI